MRKAAISFVKTVCPPIRMEQLYSHWTDFHEISYLRIFRKFVEKIKVWLKYDKNKWHFMWQPVYFYDKLCGGCVYCIRMSRILTVTRTVTYCYRQWVFAWQRFGLQAWGGRKWRTVSEITCHISPFFFLSFFLSASQSCCLKCIIWGHK
jgi:hypothetical protein